MPKIPANPHSLYLVRKELGWTQQKLAEKCGVAAVTIKKVEGRSLKPSLDLIGRIMWATGADPESLTTDKPTFQGQPYTAELGNAHVLSVKTKSKCGELEISDFETGMVGEWGAVLGTIIMTAAKKNAFYSVGFLFEQWAKSIISDFKLGPEILKISADPGSKLAKIQKGLKSRKKA